MSGDDPTVEAVVAPGLGHVSDSHPVNLISVGSAARTSSGARILDRGYRRYDGQRGGRAAAIRSLTGQTLQRALGIRRSFWVKIFPLLSIFIAYVPAIVFVGVTALLKDTGPEAEAFIRTRLLPTYAQFYRYIWAAILVFIGFVAPEVLCTDRRNGLLGLYLASPLTRTTYLVSKALAVAIAIALVTVGPPILYLVGLSLNDHGPDGFGAFLSTLAQVVIAGIAVSAVPVSLSLAVSATTTRRAAASASIIMILTATWILTETLVKAAGLNANLYVFNLLFLPFELVFRIFNTGRHLDFSWATVSTPTIVMANVAWTLGFTAFVWLRYRRLQVSR